MAASKAKAPRNSTPPRAAPARTSSHTRFKSPIQRSEGPKSGAHAPSTLPPPPFESEAEVQGLEWWLDAHMGLAQELLCLAQLLDGLEDDPAHTETVRRLAAHTEAVRDALYELYCDAADSRLAALTGSGAPLERQVRATYAWCLRVVALLTKVTSGLGAGGPDWSAAKAGFREATLAYMPPSEALLDAVRGLLIDFSSPVEPLRNLQQDTEQLFAVAVELQSTLSKRFG